ncbi:MAG: amidohydrolase [Pseudomonadota bacterium]
MSSTTPEKILLGRILTLDDAGTVGEAIAIADGRVLAVGTRAEVLARRGPATLVNDLGTATVIPGFNDAHAHMEREGMKTFRPSLANLHSVPEILQRIEAIATIAPRGSWIVTMPIGQPPYYFDALSQLAEKRMPTRQELDRAAPHHPVCIPGLFGNWGAPPGYTALNSLALKLNGIDRDTVPRCKGLEIGRDEHGEPTGLIIERNSRPTVEFDLLPAVPRFGFEDRLEGLRRAIALYHAKGTTSVYEGHGSAPEVIATYRRLWERGELTMRAGLVVSPTWSNLIEAERAMRDWLASARGMGFGDPMLRISGIHVAYGGDPVVADLARRNLPDTGWSGFVEQAVTPDDFEALCMLAARFDLRLHTIIGDRLEELVPILRRVAERIPIADRRWVVEHIGLARPEDLRALKVLGLTVTLIPVYYLWKGGGRYLTLAPSDAEMVMPARQLLELGIPVSAGTDNIPYDPMTTLWAMAARQERLTGRAIGADARLSHEQALRLLTVNGAWLTFDEAVKGPLTAGRYADLAVLSRDPLATETANLQDIDCLATLVGGQLVHGALE